MGESRGVSGLSTHGQGHFSSYDAGEIYDFYSRALVIQSTRKAPCHDCSAAVVDQKSKKKSHGIECVERLTLYSLLAEASACPWRYC